MPVFYSTYISKAQPLRQKKNVISSFVLIISLSTAIFAAKYYMPLRVYETLAIISFVSSPFWLIVFFLTRKMTLNNGGYTAIRNVALTICLIFSATLYINSKYDKSAPIEQTLNIIDKGYTYARHSSSKFYTVTLPIPTKSRLPFKLDNIFHQSVSEGAYKEVIPNQTQAKVVSRNGFFNFPWRQSCQIVFAPPEFSVEDSRAIDNYIQATITADKDSNFNGRRDAVFAELPPKLANAATYKLATRYLKGEGVTKDNKKAFDLYQKCANAGSDKCEHDVGSMYDNGLGVEADKKMAFQWIKKSAEHGNVAGQDDLGVFYGDGKGVPQDWVQSYLWISRSAKQGYIQASKDLDYAKAHMTLEQIKQAQSLAQE